MSDLLSECIVYTWDYHSSISFWSGLRVQPILADEVQTFKALITVHKVLQEGHPVVRLIQTVTLPILIINRLSKKPMVRLHGSRLVPERLVRMDKKVGGNSSHLVSHLHTLQVMHLSSKHMSNSSSQN